MKKLINEKECSDGRSGQKGFNPVVVTDALHDITDHFRVKKA